MKALLNKFFIFYFLVAILFSCSSVPKEYLKNDNSHCYKAPIFKITKDEMTSDTLVLIKKRNPIEYNNEEYREIYFGFLSDYSFIKVDSIKRIRKKIEYDLDGKITKSYFSYIDGNCSIGKKTYYDKQGEITKIKKFNEKDKICWLEALSIVKNKAKKEIKKYEIKTFRLRHFVEKKTKKTIWSISLRDGNEKYKEFRLKRHGNILYYINTETGKNIIRYRTKKRIRNLKYSLINFLNPVPKEFLENNDICHYNDPIFKITKDEMTFDVEKYGKKVNSGRLVFFDKYKFKNDFYKSKDGSITFKLTNKQLNIQRIIEYNKNGNIWLSYFKYLNGSSYIGKETEYDEQGNITKVIDYEKGYKICWAEAIEIVKQIAKKDIKKYEIKEFYLSRSSLGNRPTWIVGFMSNDNEKFSEEIDKKGKINYVIDGVTGKLNRTYRTRMIY